MSLPNFCTAAVSCWLEPLQIAAAINSAMWQLFEGANYCISVRSPCQRACSGSTVIMNSVHLIHNFCLLISRPDQEITLARSLPLYCNTHCNTPPGIQHLIPEKRDLHQNQCGLLRGLWQSKRSTVPFCNAVCSIDIMLAESSSALKACLVAKAQTQTAIIFKFYL